MEKHKVDQLFSEKLSDFEQSPSINAWEQLEDELDKKQRKPYGLWLSIAASAALAIVSSWYLLTMSEDETTLSYNYAELSTSEAALPTEIIYVPVYIQVPASDQQTIEKTVASKQKKITPAVPSIANTTTPVIMASNTTDNTPNVKDTTIPEVLDIEEVPLQADPEETLIASLEPKFQEVSAEEEPQLTIIYKQGEPAKESNFTKAINYMEDVRLGEKKLVNFEKLRDNIKAKFKSNKDVNTK
jgi:hypothetical protein